MAIEPKRKPERQVCRFKVLRVFDPNMGEKPSVFIGQYNRMEACYAAAELRMSQEVGYKEVRHGFKPAEYADFIVFEYDTMDQDHYYMEPQLVNYCRMDQIIDKLASSVSEVLGRMKATRVTSRISIIN